MKTRIILSLVMLLTVLSVKAQESVETRIFPTNQIIAPHLIEVTPEKQVVWTFADHATMKTISSVQLLDVTGDVMNGGILH